MSCQKHFATVLILIALIGTASAADYYVSPTGSGAHDGSTTANAFSLSEAKSYANSHLNEQIIFLLVTGNYGEVQFSDAVSRLDWNKGTTYQAAPAESPVFDNLDIRGNENRYLTFKNINVTAPSDSDYDAVVYVKDSSYIKLIDCNITGRWDIPGSGQFSRYGIKVDGVNTGVYGVVIDGCDVKDAGRGIILYHDIRDGVVIRNSHVHHVGGSIILVNTAHNQNEIIIENNHLHDRQKFGGYHGSAIALDADHITIRGNLIHDFGGTASICFYADNLPPGGYDSMLIENNLIYDKQGVTNASFELMQSDITIRNNTFIGSYSGRADTRFKYGTVVALNAYNSSNGVPNLKIYNNVFVGIMGFKTKMVNWQNYLEENNNIFWALLDTSSGSTQYPSPLGPNSIMVYTDNNYFEGSGNFFAGGSLFDQYSYTFNTWHPELGTNGIFSSHKQNLNDAYKLAPGSPAIGFADPAQAPATDLLGNPRDLEPDAGAYEFAPACQTKQECNDTYQCKTLVDCISGQCIYQNKAEGTTCDDQDSCTDNDACSSGTCQGTAKDCDDGIACTDDSCLAGACQNTANDSLCPADTACADHYCDAALDCQVTYNIGAACDDGIVCTEGDACDAAGNCLAGTANDSLCPDYAGCNTKTCNATTGCVYTPAGCDVPPDLVLWTKFENDTQDSSTYGNHGTFQGGTPNYLEGKVGQALEFDGTDDKVETENNVFSDSTFSDGITLIAWVKGPASTSDTQIISIEGAYYLGTSETGHHTFHINGDLESFRSTTQLDNTWHFIAGAADSSGNIKLFVDGVEENSGNQNYYSIDSSDMPTAIGSHPTIALHFNGLIDEAKIYNKALTSQEILALYNETGQECVDTQALLNYIGQWKQGQITMLVLMQKIAKWKAGTGCP